MNREEIIKSHRADDKYVYCIGHCCDWHYRTSEEFKQFKGSIHRGSVYQNGSNDKRKQK